MHSLLGVVLLAAFSPISFGTCTSQHLTFVVYSVNNRKGVRQPRIPCTAAEKQQGILTKSRVGMSKQIIWKPKEGRG